MYKVIKLLVLFLLIMFTILTVLFRQQIGFPNVHPIYADCIGIKREKTDESGTKRIYCYGFIYNYWLE